MIGLVAVELRRAMARRVVWGMSALLLVVLAISGLIVFRDHQNQPARDVDAQIAVLQAEQDRFERECRAELPTDQHDLCDSPPVTEADVFVTDQRLRPQDIWRERDETWFAYGNGTEGQVDLVETGADGEQGMLLGFLVLWATVAAVIGAGLIGAEYRAGTIETTVLWEPRRRRVILAKYVAGMVTAAIGTAGAALATFVALAPALLVRGTTAGMDADYWSGVVGATGRGAFVAALAALAAMALATITRATAGGIAVLLLGLSGSEILLRVVGSDLARFLPSSNAYAVISRSPIRRDVIGTGLDALSHGTLGAAVICVGSVAVVTTVAVVLFERLDL